MTETKDAIDPMIQDIVKAVVEASDPDRIILFGSAARGDNTGAGSDVDLLVVEKESSFRGGSRWSESSRIRKVLWRFPVPIDILIFTPEEVEK
ncbi:MAG: nucleotidyltransferase domain-containing protein, partial [Deltaproteobacteria bacterium]|nr:nucleotidyltransferase domain-containing protein [Deltaproteobacteria bacterium]